MSLNNYIVQEVNTLLENTLVLFEKLCINPVSEKVLFFIEYIDEKTNNRSLSIKYNIDSLKLISFNELIEVIFEEQEYLSWVDFTIIYSNIDLTLIKVTLVKVNKVDEKINFHANIKLPINYNQNEKFDINEIYNLNR